MWLATFGVRREQFWQYEVSDAAALLVEYGQVLFRDGKPKASFKYTLLGAQDQRDSLRLALEPAWNALTNWEKREPGGRHNPLPQAAHEAGLAVAVVWQWREFTAARW